MKTAWGITANTALIAAALFASINLAGFVHGNPALIELVLISTLAAVGALLVYAVSSCRWAWPGLLVWYSINMINSAVFFWALGFSWSALIILLSSFTGFGAAMWNSFKSKEPEECAEVSCAAQTKADGCAAPEPAPAEAFEPGKYVASKSGARYHTPSCDWAVKITEKNRVWYKTRREAEKEGKDACECTE